MLRQRLIRQETPEKDAVLMSEWKIATAGLILSMFIIVCKIYDHNSKYFRINYVNFMVWWYCYAVHEWPLIYDYFVPCRGLPL